MVIFEQMQHLVVDDLEKVDDRRLDRVDSSQELLAGSVAKLKVWFS